VPDLLEAGAFSVDMYTMPEPLIRTIWEFVVSAMMVAGREGSEADMTAATRSIQRACWTERCGRGYNMDGLSSMIDGPGLWSLITAI